VRRTVILGVGCKEKYSQAILATVQFGMFHVLNYKTDIVPVILVCYVKIRKGIDGLWYQGG